MMDDPVSKRYTESDYLEHNPEWDRVDSPWKADRVVQLLGRFSNKPETICEVGCGAGAVLGSLKNHFPMAKFTGYDIAPDVGKFWAELRQAGVDLHVGDFFVLNEQSYDLILLLDVLEHVADPHQFLVNLKPFTNRIIIHFHLDLSAISVVREKPLLHVRRKVGHIHYFTKGLALELLDECGFDVIAHQYTGAAFNTPQAGVKTRLAQLPRRIVYALNKDIGVRLLGGETMMVLAKPK